MQEGLSPLPAPCSLGRLQSTSGEELSPLLHFGDCRFAACAIPVNADYPAFARGPRSVAE
jgi:hypothetical protein